MRGHHGRRTIPQSIPYPGPGSQIFTTSGNFTVPLGVSSIIVQCWGGGAAGHAINAGAGKAYGGCGGNFAQKTLTVVSGDIYSVTVADISLCSNGAYAGAYGNQGNPSSFGGSVCLATGGFYQQNYTVTNSSVGSIGDIIRVGGNKGNASVASGGGGGGAGTDVNGGNGGIGTAGTGGSVGGGNGAAGVSGTSSGAAGSNFGGGGSGASRTFIGTSYGGTGAQGKIIVSW